MSRTRQHGRHFEVVMKNEKWIISRLIWDQFCSESNRWPNFIFSVCCYVELPPTEKINLVDCRRFGWILWCDSWAHRIIIAVPIWMRLLHRTCTQKQTCRWWLTDARLPYGPVCVSQRQISYWFCFRAMILHGNPTQHQKKVYGTKNIVCILKEHFSR